MKFSFDLRFAHFPCGGRTSVATLIRLMLEAHPQTAWRLYHNPGDPPQDEIVAALRPFEPRIEYYPIKHTCLSLGQHMEFLRVRDKAAVYHYPHFDMPLGMRGPKLFMTIHDLYPLVLPGYCSGMKRAYFKYLCRKNGARAARIITISQCTKRDILKHLGLPERKIVVIPQGVSEAYRPIKDREAWDRVQKRYQLPKHFILYCGNHKKHKNLERLLEAYARLPGSLRGSVALILTGPITAETHRLHELAERLGLAARVQFLGMVPGEDLPVLYNLAGLVVQPSLYEGFGLPMVEAMACGTPVVYANAGALPEVAGPAGRKFDPYDLEGMADALRKGIEQDMGNELCRKQSRQQAALFGWDKTAALTYAQYERAAAE